MQTFLLETGSPKPNLTSQDSPRMAHPTEKSPDGPTTTTFDEGKYATHFQQSCLYSHLTNDNFINDYPCFR